MKLKKIISGILLILVMFLLVFPFSVSGEAEAVYSKIPKFDKCPQNQVFDILNDAGINYKIIYDEYNDNEPGTVFRFVYYGYSDKHNYYVNSATEVTLYVSGKAPAPVTVPIKNSVKSDESNIIYLTFDDGPYKEKTQTVLDILKKYDIKATFFLVGKSAETYPDLVKQIYNDGHTIACHSYSHDFNYIYSSVDIFELEITQWEKIIRNILGKDLDYKIFRFPGGSNVSYISEAMYPNILSKLNELGYNPFDWTLANNDAWTVQKRYNQTMDDFLKSSLKSTLAIREKTPTVPKIVLMHDTKEDTIKMLEWAIQYLIENGYVFGTLDTLNGGWLF